MHPAADPDPGLTLQGTQVTAPKVDPASEVAGSASPASISTVAAPRMPAAGLLWWVSLLIVALDQITKALVQQGLAMSASKTIVPGLIDLVHVHNAGVAFGLLNDFVHPQRSVVTTILALIALVGIAYYARHVGPGERMARVGLSLILGGAVGNLLDRVRQGFVVDFVDVYWRDWHFWAFNVADAAITVGAVLIFFELLVPGRHASHSV